MATRRQIVVSTEDLHRLADLLDSELVSAFRDQPYVQTLQNELRGALVLPPNEITGNIVTMNSTVRLLELDSNEEEVLTLVYPDAADIAQGRLSVLAPIGTAILGRRVGDLVTCQVPRGTTRLRIAELLFQPERDQIAA